VALGILVVLATSVAAIATKLGVIVVLGVALLAVGALFVYRRGFTFVEVVAFLIHFDGIGRGGISVGRIVSVAAILLFVYKLYVERWRPPAVPMRYWFPPVLVMTWGFASAAWGPEIGQFVVGVGTFALAFAYFAISAFLVDSVDKIRKWMRAYWYGGIFGAIAGVWGLVLGLRSFGFNRDANLFGVLAASMIPLTIYYRRQATTTRQKVLYTFVLLLVLAGAAGAGSRSGIIGAAVALFASIVYRPGFSIGHGLKRALPAALVTAAVALLMLLNPNTLIRGTDSSGRLDFWNITVDLIAEQPLHGVGLGQMDAMLPPLMPVTPGVERLKDSRDEVSSHNTYLDLTGDLGLIGVLLFISVIGMTVIGLLTPRWSNTKEVSGYLFLMFLPVLSGSMFLSLINNKLAWSIVGLAAALQVPSWGARWKGYFSGMAGSGGGSAEDGERRARWDLKVSQRFRVWIVLGAMVGAVAFPLAGSTVPTQVSASRSIFVPKLDVPPDLPRVTLDMDRLQWLHNMVLSDNYAFELGRLAGVDADTEQISNQVFVVRNDAGPFMELGVRGPDEQLVETLSPHLTDAVDSIVDRGREVSEDSLRDELRPSDPGEQRYYTGPIYLEIGDEPDFSSEGPRFVWLFLVGASTGALSALALVLMKQRYPRVNNDDDFETAVGMNLWTHVGRNGRRNAATADQFAQVAVTAFESVETPSWPRRILVTAPRSSRSSRAVSMGVAASLVSSGERVLLVDGQPERRLLSWRLGGARAPGMTDLADRTATLQDCIRRVRRWRLPKAVRNTLTANAENLRFLPAGRSGASGEATVDPEVLDELDDEVIVVMLSPPLLGTVPVSPCLRRFDVVLYNLVEGETVTSDAEDAALQVATFAQGPAGVVLSDV
jgi:hypothetical protein